MRKLYDFADKKGHFSAFFLLFILCLSPLFADDDCLSYKVLPQVTVSSPEWAKSVVRSLRPMNMLHGNVAATFIETYNLSASAEQIEDGFCVVLNSVEAVVGYTDFLIQIDSRYAPDSCRYNATMEHEDMHIRAHLSVVDDLNSEISSAISHAANTVMPLFVRTNRDADAALDKMSAEIQDNPNVILMRQKINAEQEMKNKRIDQNAGEIKCD